MEQAKYLFLFNADDYLIEIMHFLSKNVSTSAASLSICPVLQLLMVHVLHTGHLREY